MLCAADNFEESTIMKKMSRIWSLTNILVTYEITTAQARTKGEDAGGASPPHQA